MNQQNAQRDRCSHSDQQQSKFVHLSVIPLVGYRVAPEKVEQQINFEWAVREQRQQRRAAALTSITADGVS